MVPGPAGNVACSEKPMNEKQRPVAQIIGFIVGVLLLGIGVYTGMNGATAIGLILAMLNVVIWLRDRTPRKPE
jgi:hypothetical protein